MVRRRRFGGAGVLGLAWAGLEAAALLSAGWLEDMEARLWFYYVVANNIALSAKKSTRGMDVCSQG
jgi:hypothetical protein